MDAARRELEQFMDGLRKRNPGEPEFHQAVHEVAESVLPYVLEHPEYPHSLESLSTRAHMSRSVFARRFVEHLGLTPMDYVFDLSFQTPGPTRLNSSPS